MHVGTDFLKLPPVTGQYWSLFQCSMPGTGGTCDGNVIVADNHQIRKVTPDSTVTAVAGSGNATFADGQGSFAHFKDPWGMHVDGGGIIIVAMSNHRICKITPHVTLTTLARCNRANFADTPRLSRHFNFPLGVVVDGDGNVIVAHIENHWFWHVHALPCTALHCPAPLCTAHWTLTLQPATVFAGPMGAR